jgi:hypothetical protein
VLVKDGAAQHFKLDRSGRDPAPQGLAVKLVQAGQGTVHAPSFFLLPLAEALRFLARLSTRSLASLRRYESPSI